jgi:hypothetical protein
MLLQAREGTHVADSPFDRILQSNGLVGSGRDDDDFSSLDPIPVVSRNVNRSKTKKKKAYDDCPPPTINKPP